MLKFDAVDIQLLLVLLFYIICCPYTKVEESFNMQAIFDITQFGTSLNSYDHLEFPGVVPRTFLGAIPVSIILLPLRKLITFFSMPELYDQMAARTVIGLFSWLSYVHFRNGIETKFGTRASQLTGVLTSFQFHICFYMSRSLPNVFALMICLNAFAYWLKGRPMKSIVLLTIATVIFRCDILVFLGPFTLQLLLSREIQFLDTAFLGIAAGAVALCLTVLVDSIFWQRWMWPEGVVFFFNTVQNRSAEWGIMPWHWYASHALLKALNITILWMLVGILGISFPKKTLLQSAHTEEEEETPFSRFKKLLYEFLCSNGFLNTKLLYYILPAVNFIVLYSFLPHKELRFIFPALPLFTLAGGVGLDAILPGDSSMLLYPLSLLQCDSQARKRKKLDRQRLCSMKLYTAYRYTLSVIVLSSFAGMIVIASGLLSASHRNYPGAEALDRLTHQHIPMYLLEHSAAEAGGGGGGRLPAGFHPLFVHIDAAAAMSGVTRFLQKRFLWVPPSTEASLQHTPLSATPSSSSSNSGYLNLDPTQATAVNACFIHPAEQCKQVVDLVYYSKNEKLTDYTLYDWLITADPTRALASGHFEIAERVKAYQGIALSWSGFIVNLKTELYILVNTHEH